MKIKKLILIIFLVFFIVCSNICYASTDNIMIDSEVAILLNNTTGKVIFEKNADQKMFPASTTKILTAIITLENCDLTDIATASYEAVMTVPPRIF